jgi:hypothetical protein
VDERQCGRHSGHNDRNLPATIWMRPSDDPEHSPEKQKNGDEGRRTDKQILPIDYWNVLVVFDHAMPSPIQQHNVFGHSRQRKLGTGGGPKSAATG